ncbi:uncharacterized protein N7503_009136 [Penicillium pulvis]|uniref:uncharacterized protein n=1 Tax=Penicillium pulvis TaxID=1562058 RepID=UPI002549A00D|nr:uncharacterized protein N7503_009136 [Penicillium pulvis]KAJ5793158.1 hypothetical protein N7503_009136 [Penicillium pulvis]
MSSPMTTPSKKATRAKNSSSKPATPKIPRDADSSDNRILANVLRSFDPDAKKIDLHEFAALMGYTNVRSAGNTFSRLRKAHGLKVEGYMTRAKNSTKVTKPGNGTNTSLDNAIEADVSDDNLPLSDDDDVPDNELSNGDTSNAQDEL